jgi:hypothetical protein
VRKLAARLGCEISAMRGLHQMEKARTSTHASFPCPEDGWIEVALLAAMDAL